MRGPQLFAICRPSGAGVGNKAHGPFSFGPRARLRARVWPGRILAVQPIRRSPARLGRSSPGVSPSARCGEAAFLSRASFSLSHSFSLPRTRRKKEKKLRRLPAARHAGDGALAATPSPFFSIPRELSPASPWTQQLLLPRPPCARARGCGPFLCGVSAVVPLPFPSPVARPPCGERAAVERFGCSVHCPERGWVLLPDAPVGAHRDREEWCGPEAAHSFPVSHPVSSLPSLY